MAVAGISLFDACLHKYQVVGCDYLLHFSCGICKPCLKDATACDQIATRRKSLKDLKCSCKNLG